MVKLIYIGEFGQVAKSNGELFNSKVDHQEYEEFSDIEVAKKVARAHVKKYPLMSCVIYYGNNEELYILPDEVDFKKAKAIKDIEIRELVKAQKRIGLKFDLVVYSIIGLGIFAFYKLISLI